MIIRDTYPLGVREIAVDQGTDYAFVQATVHGDRAPKGDRSVELQFWSALRDAEIMPAKAGGKHCSNCNDWQVYEAFPINTRMRDGRHSHCKTCHKKQTDRWRQTAREAA
jgi:hypothetical protein